MKSSIKEVAHLAGVSVATVSYVLNGTKHVRPETEKRVMDAVKKLNYQINPLARNFRKGESKLIGFVVCDLSNYFFQDVALGLEKRLARYGYRPILIDSKEDKNIEMENVRNLLASSVDGLIIAPTTEDCSYLNLLLANHSIPVAFVDRKPTGYDSDLVLSANVDGAYEAVKYLIAKGHRKIAFVGSRLDSTMDERAEGFRKALREAGIPVNANFIRFGDNLSLSPKELRHGAIYRHTLDLVTNHGITALLSGNNLATTGAFSCLMEMKVKIPQELAFITFDDSFWLTMTTPSLSAVAQDPDNIGEIAGRMIYERLMAARNNVQRPNQMVRVQTQLIIRGSC
ncbi:LacI family DNA-binding transcriptional regulator [Pleomorphochaeta sp. DL1XJH-081]|uniref:LacI family DNA-binding transcriptional regulator n=1 Tax=Pleomorphochaeta sp. DL1XJH-081 TaxID=3409690 RepID=UPI003BB6E014